MDKSEVIRIVVISVLISLVTTGAIFGLSWVLLRWYRGAFYTVIVTVAGILFAFYAVIMRL